jgi:DNA (cytosine-5)-methyltransferase 1
MVVLMMHREDVLQMSKQLTLCSLFDGSGGFPLAAILAGIKPVSCSEIEPFPIAVTKKRFPQVKHLGDVSKINGAQIEPVDIITFGSPCQDMSIAGKRSGLDGSRSSLFFQAIRIIKEMRCATNGKYPRFIVWENVPGCQSSNGGEDFRRVLEEICRIKDESVCISRPAKWAKAGYIMADDYSVAFRLLDAQHFGVAQRRRRLFLVADFGGQCASYYLSPRACLGILRRASIRGKQLPRVLKVALERQAQSVCVTKAESELMS